GKIEVGVRTGEGRSNHYEVHDRSGVRDSDGRKRPHEGTGGQGSVTSLIPGCNRDHHRDSQDIKKDQAKNHGAHRSGNSFFRALGFSRGNGQYLHAHVTGHGKGERKPHASKPMREETAKRGEVRKSPSGARRQPGDQDDSHADENNDRGNFYPGEPVFELSEVAYVQRIDANNPEGYDGNPDPLRNGREPELEINGNRRHLCTDSDDG